MIRRHNPRRGILLLIVLSLLVLFVLIGVTFIVVAGQYTKSAKAFSRHEQKGVSPQQQLDDALMTVLRGSNQLSNPLGRHSLLEDLYGTDGFRGEVVIAATGVNQDQFLRISFNDPQMRARPSQDYYSGSVLTLIDGSGAGQSVRVLRYTPPRVNGGGAYVRGELLVEAFNQVVPNYTVASGTRVFAPLPGTQFVVNGRQFNGLGRGLAIRANRTSGSLDVDTTTGDINWEPIEAEALVPGLLPIQEKYLPFWLPVTPTTPDYPYRGFANRHGDFDESHDAADYMNLFMARIPTQAKIAGAFDASDPLIPSFHRPFLVNFMIQQFDANNNNALDSGEPNFGDISQALPALNSIIRPIRNGMIARPLPDNHPFFTGSNPAFAGLQAGGLDSDRDGIADWLDVDSNGDGMLDDFDSDGFLDIPLTRGPWDVDNDRDGVPDSMWVDLGAPVLTTPDGRRYKPLYAILCVDMDGRANLNAHGTRELLSRPYDTTNGQYFETIEDDWLAAGFDGTGASNDDDLASVVIGQGYGPAEIRLDRVLQVQNGVDLFASVLAYRSQPKHGIRTASGFIDNTLFPGTRMLPAPFLLSTRDDAEKALIHNWGLPADFTDLTQPNLYRSPPDLAGTSAVYLDHAGRPVYELHQNVPGAVDSVVGTPYPWTPKDTYLPVNLPITFTPVPAVAAQHNPYAVDLISGTGNDRLFSDEDLEQLLRFNDLDQRDLEQGYLMSALGPIGQQMLELGTTTPAPVPIALNPETFAWSRRLTTRSFDIPTLNMVVTDAEERAEIRQQAWEEYNRLRQSVARLQPVPAEELRLTSTSIVEVVTRRLQRAYEQANGVDLNLDNATRVAWEQSVLIPQLQIILPPEIRQGRKFDINRPFGNGIDDNNNGVIDEPGEVDGSGSEPAMWAGTMYQTAGIGTFAHDNVNAPDTSLDPFFDPSNTAGNIYRRRQVFARHLFCLALLAMDRNFQIDDTNREATMRRIAQWAINVVDNRDPDAIMTPFEYDVNPFDEDGWAVDGYVNTDDLAVEPDRRVVWGCESPELLITETLAFHDRGIADRGVAGDRFPTENTDDGDTMNDIVDVIDDTTSPAGADQVDNDLDQVKIPQGSLFIEMYATGSRPLPAAATFQRTAPIGSRPFELYHTADRSAPSQELNLAATSLGGESSVWRIALVEPPESLDPTNLTEEEAAVYGPQWGNVVLQDDELNTQLNDQDAVTSRLQQSGRPDQALTNDADARFIVFTPTVPAVMPSIGTYYVNKSANTHIVPGGYAVLGPRAVTPIGAATTTDPAQEIDLDLTAGQNNVLHHDPASSTTFWNVRTNAYRDAAGVDLTNLNATSNNSPQLRNFIIASPQPMPWTNNNPRFAFGIGMSISEPTPTAYYSEPEDDLTYTSPRDRPTDFDRGPLQGLFDDLEFENDDMHGTYPRFRVALLQRLANPLLPWNAETNPYITVDTQMIDLTVFNSSEDSVPAGWKDAANPHSSTPYALDPISEDDPPTLQPGLQLVARSRERGQRQETNAAQGPNIWSPLSPNIDSISPTIFADAPIDNGEVLPQTLAPDSALQGTPNWPYRFIHSLGALNSTYEFGTYGTRIGAGTKLPGQRLSQITAQSPYIGAPVLPTTIWVNWMDRPYVSHLELMQVPSSAPWRFAYETRRVELSSGELENDFHRGFAHLMNFFYNDPTGDDPNFAALLEWVEVPSRFVGTQKLLRPLNYVNMPPEVPGLPAAIREFAPPFNKISTFRDPGKININTIPDALVWSAVDAQTPWADVQESLAGPDEVRNRPAFYSNPIRAAGSPPLTDDPSSNDDDPERISSAEATLLRRDPDDQNRFLFEPPVSVGSDQKEANNPEQHPHFRYQNLQRLGNLVTSHSNVYGVWITVGYFEVYPWNASDPYLTASPPLPSLPDQAHPDGWQLGPELGYDSGEVQRHRAFYLIDRSVPVGFERGQDHNAEDAVLLKRFID